MKKTILILLVFALCAPLAFGEKINWETIVRQTTEKNPSIKSAELRLENAKQSYNRSLSGFMPSISLSGSASQSERDKNFSRSYSYGLNANLSIFSGFETYNEVKQKSAELKAAQADYDRIISDIAYETATQYINLMWAYETVELSKHIKERRTENKDMIQLKYNSGNVDVGSLRRVEADVELSSYDLKKAQRYIETASAALLKAIGRSDEITLETDEKILIADRSLSTPDYAGIITKTPEYMIAQLDIDIYKAQSSKAKGQWWPEVSISGGVSRYDNEWAPNKQGWDAGLSLSYPLFTGGTRYADVQIAANLLKIADQNLKNTTNALRARAISYFNSLTDSFENITTREHYLSASQLQAEISQRKYVNGLSTYQDWYSIENDYISSQKTLLDAKKAAALEKAAWHNFKGDGFIDPGK